VSKQDAIVKRLSKWYSGDIHDCLDKLGIWGVLEGLDLFGHLPESGRVCGRVTTVQFVPTEKRVESKRYHDAIDNVGDGGILVVDTAGARGSCTGELMCTGAKAHGGICTVVNGTIRDLEEIEKLGYPVYAAGVLPVTAVGRMEDLAWNVDLRIGGVRVRPDDIVFADRDGAIVVPGPIAPVVADMADKLGKLERDYKARIVGGEALTSVFSDIY
jgi:4-hydroxy-4-methyl-2-oxoglutarate aldolase